MAGLRQRRRGTKENPQPTAKEQKENKEKRKKKGDLNETLSVDNKTLRYTHKYDDDDDKGESMWLTIKNHWTFPLWIITIAVALPYGLYLLYLYLRLQKPHWIGQLTGGLVQWRPAVCQTNERQVLIVGTMSSGTSQVAHELKKELQLEVGHETAETRWNFVRDGTVSWFHGIRFLSSSLHYHHHQDKNNNNNPQKDENIKRHRFMGIAHLCRQLLPGMGIHPLMFRDVGHCSIRDTSHAGAGGRGSMIGGLLDRFLTSINGSDGNDAQPWSKCWIKECMTVLDQEWGCATNQAVVEASVSGTTQGRRLGQVVQSEQDLTQHVGRRRGTTPLPSSAPTEAERLIKAATEGDDVGSNNNNDKSSSSVAPLHTCPTPFRRVLHQVRHPLRTIESLVVKFCRGGGGDGDDASASPNGNQQQDEVDARSWLHKGTLHPSFVTVANALFGGTPSEFLQDTTTTKKNDPQYDQDEGSSHSHYYYYHNFSTYTCLEGTSYYWLEYTAAMDVALQQGRIHHRYQVETTSPCQVAQMAGFLESPTAVYTPHVERLQTQCRLAGGGGGEGVDAKEKQQRQPQHEQLPMVSTQYSVNQKKNNNKSTNKQDGGRLQQQQRALTLTWDDFLGGRHGSTRPTNDTALVEHLQYWTVEKLGYPVVG